MGRPINKKYLGDPARVGQQVVFTACWFALESAPSANPCFVKRQVGTGRFQAEDSVTGHLGAVRIVNGALPLEPGQATIAVTPFGGGPVEYARVIHNRSVKTWQDHQYRWSILPAGKAGDADLPMA